MHKKIPTVSGTHPLLKGAVVSVLALCVVGTLAVANWLPGSKGNLSRAIASAAAHKPAQR